MSVDLPAPLPPTRPMTSPAKRSIDDAPDRVHAAERDVDVPHLHERHALGHRSSSHPPSAATTAVVRVETDGDDEHDAGHDALDRRGHAHEGEAVREGRHDDGAEDGAGIVPMPPAKDVPPTTAAAMT